MKVAISATGTTLESQMDPRFGRCDYFLIIDTDSEELAVINNEMNVNAVDAAGIQAAALVADHNVDFVVTGHCGPKAFNTLNTAKIPVYCCDGGSVREGLEKLKRNELQILNRPDVRGHWQ